MRLARLAPSLAALLVALAASAMLIAIAGGNPILALTTLAQGAFGSAYAWSEVGVRTCPLLLTGLAVATPSAPASGTPAPRASC